jgi:hypothetical protein
LPELGIDVELVGECRTKPLEHRRPCRI